MQSRTYYKQNSGEIITSFSGDLSMVDMSAYENYAYIEDFGDSKTQYVENGTLKNMPAKPDFDSVFDFESKTWINPEAEVRWAFVRSQRDRDLFSSDWTQGLDSPLSNEKKLEWASYRQALRDITTQPDPFNVIWPIKPR